MGRKLKAIILAAGFATRLYPLTENQPKPLLTINNKPLLEHIINQISEIPNLEEIIIVSNQKFLNHFQKWRTNFITQIPITIINNGSTSNENRLGAIKDLLFAINHQNLNNEELLAIAGDNLIQFSFQDFYNQFRQQSQHTIAVYDIQDIEKVRNKHGIAIVNQNQQVTNFQEKPSEPKSTLKSICCYLFKPNIKSLLEAYLQSNNPDATGFFIEWLIHQTPTYAFQFQEPVYDIGNLESYYETNRIFSEEQQNL